MLSSYELHIFVGVLGASGYIYWEVHRSQNLPNWVRAHIHIFEFYGGVPKIVRPDNLKAGVTKPRFCAPLLRPATATLPETPISSLE
jgi:transposase